MPAKEIFQQLAQHQLEGVMFHEAMSQYFHLLNLRGFEETQINQMKDELSNLNITKWYYYKWYYALLDIPATSNKPSFIPPEWYVSNEKRTFTSEQKQKYIRDGFAKWLEWEKSTKAIYTTLLTQMRATEPDGIHARWIQELIKDVNDEIVRIREWIMKLTSYDYDIYTIDSMQQDLYDMLCFKKAQK